MIKNIPINIPIKRAVGSIASAAILFCGIFSTPTVEPVLAGDVFSAATLAPISAWEKWPKGRNQDGKEPVGEKTGDKYIGPIEVPAEAARAWLKHRLTVREVLIVAPDGRATIGQLTKEAMDNNATMPRRQLRQEEEGRYKGLIDKVNQARARLSLVPQPLSTGMVSLDDKGILEKARGAEFVVLLGDLLVAGGPYAHAATRYGERIYQGEKILESESLSVDQVSQYMLEEGVHIRHGDSDHLLFRHDRGLERALGEIVQQQQALADKEALQARLFALKLLRERLKAARVDKRDFRLAGEFVPQGTSYLRREPGKKPTDRPVWRIYKSVPHFVESWTVRRERSDSASPDTRVAETPVGTFTYNIEDTIVMIFGDKHDQAITLTGQEMDSGISQIVQETYDTNTHRPIDIYVVSPKILKEKIDIAALLPGGEELLKPSSGDMAARKGIPVYKTDEGQYRSAGFDNPFILADGVPDFGTNVWGSKQKGEILIKIRPSRDSVFTGHYLYAWKGSYQRWYGIMLKPNYDTAVRLSRTRKQGYENTVLTAFFTSLRNQLKTVGALRSTIRYSEEDNSLRVTPVGPHEQKGKKQLGTSIFFVGAHVFKGRTVGSPKKFPNVSEVIAEVFEDNPGGNHELYWIPNAVLHQNRELRATLDVLGLRFGSMPLEPEVIETSGGWRLASGRAPVTPGPLGEMPFDGVFEYSSPGYFGIQRDLIISGARLLKELARPLKKGRWRTIYADDIAISEIIEADLEKGRPVIMPDGWLAVATLKGDRVHYTEDWQSLPGMTAQKKAQLEKRMKDVRRLAMENIDQGHPQNNIADYDPKKAKAFLQRTPMILTSGGHIGGMLDHVGVAYGPRWYLPEVLATTAPLDALGTKFAEAAIHGVYGDWKHKYFKHDDATGQQLSRLTGLPDNLTVKLVALAGKIPQGGYGSGASELTWDDLRDFRGDEGTPTTKYLSPYSRFFVDINWTKMSPSERVSVSISTNPEWVELPRTTLKALWRRQKRENWVGAREPFSYTKMRDSYKNLSNTVGVKVDISSDENVTPEEILDQILHALKPGQYPSYMRRAFLGLASRQAPEVYAKYSFGASLAAKGISPTIDAQIPAAVDMSL